MRKLEKWIEISADTKRVFNIFADFESIPRWMPSVREVRLTDERRARWSAAAPAGTDIEGDVVWETVTTAYEPHEHIAWRTVSGNIGMGGEAYFEETRRGTTLVRLLLGYELAGPLEAAASGTLDENLRAQLEGDLGRFKRLAEAGSDTAHTPPPASTDTIADPEATREMVRSDALLAAAAAASSPPPLPPTRHRVTIESRRPDVPSQPPDWSPKTRSDRWRTLPLVYVGLASAVLTFGIGALWNMLQPGPAAPAGSTQAASATLPPGDSRETPTSSAPLAAANTGNNPATLATTATDAKIAPSTNMRDASTAGATAEPRGAQGRQNRGSTEVMAELRATLQKWVTATNSRDIDKQMTFYSSVVERYYLAKNFSRAAVRANKERLFARGAVSDVTISEPEIIFSDDGRTVIMRFRKQYTVEGDSVNRREVLQELIWQRTGDGWKIISERDLQVLR